jgi:hypothetical protein
MAHGSSGSVDMAHGSSGSFDMAMPTGGCGAANLLINEVQTDGATATDEWVEIYNPCTTAVTLDGKLVYRGPSSTADSNTLASFTNKTFPAQGYFLIANDGYSGTADIAKFTSSGLGAAGGGVGLRDSSDALLTSMAWGASTSNGFQQGSPAAAPGTSKSAARKPNGTSTHNDSADFTVGAPTPRAPN